MDTVTASQPGAARRQRARAENRRARARDYGLIWLLTLLGALGLLFWSAVVAGLLAVL